jgi:hypothetical protein
MIAQIKVILSPKTLNFIKILNFKFSNKFLLNMDSKINFEGQGDSHYPPVFVEGGERSSFLKVLPGENCESLHIVN